MSTTEHSSIQEYYATRESRWGYRLFLSNTRHFGYYDASTSWPFPVSRALRRMERRLFESLGLEKGKVLDAGCGAANVAAYMASQGLQVTAIDLVDRHLDIARSNVQQRGLADRIDIKKMNYQDLAFPDTTFDGVYTMETFVHATNPKKGLAEFYRVLKPGGRVVLFEYDRAEDKDMPEVAQRAFARVNQYASMPTFQAFTYGVPEQMLAEAGFTDIKLEDITDHILPMLRLFAIVAYLPYQIIRLFRQEHRFVNAMSAVEYYCHRRYLRYIIVTANKPS